MSKIVKWIKTGKRGARAEFTDSDILTALILISKESMGRYKLQEKLLLSESSTKSLLNYCKSKKLLTTTPGRTGHSLAENGMKVIALVNQRLYDYGDFDYQAFENKQHYFTSLKCLKNKQEDPSWKIRDIAIAYGAEAILLFDITDDLTIKFPENEIQVLNYFPDLELKMDSLFNKPKQKQTKILIVAANTIELARKSALITAINTESHIRDKILFFF